MKMTIVLMLMLTLKPRLMPNMMLKTKPKADLKLMSPMLMQKRKRMQRLM